MDEMFNEANFSNKDERESHISSLNQLMTISGILTGFAFSGLMTLPSIDLDLYNKIVESFQGDLTVALAISFYALFFSSLCFLSTIMTVLIYRIGNYFVPLNKLRRIHIVSSLLFSIAISSLLISVICFGIPNETGILIALAMGLGVGTCFVWENMVPWQKRVREKQIARETERRENKASNKAVEKKEEEKKETEVKKEEPVHKEKN